MKIIFNPLECITLFIVILMIIGQIQCIYKLFSCDFEPSYKAEIIYSVSVITGIGAVTRYMDFDK